MSAVRAVALTGRGRVRTANEDAVMVFEWISQAPRPHLVELRAGATAPLLCAVADGMGGHPAGRLASALALELTAQQYPEWTDQAALRAGLVLVNTALHDAACRHANTKGMGTTIAGIVFVGERVLCFNIGDSRVYQITDGYVEQLSVDDTAPAPDGKPSNRITQALGDPPGRLDPHIVEVPLTGEASRFLLCTDGVTSVLDPACFRRLCRSPELAALVAGLRDAVYQAGAEDNLSIVAVDLPGARSAVVNGPRAR